MTRLILTSTAMIGAAAYQVQAAAARDVVARHAAAHRRSDCVRAPAQGAFATAPYNEPPCVPKTTN